MPYKAPKKIERKEALLGTNEKIQATYKRTFSSGVRKLFRLSYKVNTSPFFKPIHNADPSDWLLNHKEVGQTYEEFLCRLTSCNDLGHVDTVSRTKQRTIFILPIGEFPPLRSSSKAIKNPLMSWLESYCTAFFSTAQVKVLKAASLENVACEYRVNEFTGRYQLNASDILGYLRQRKTKNQDCLIAVTMVDLYPKPSWNFVFGLASTSKIDVGGVGVFSFCRYVDDFYETWSLSEDKVRRNPDGSLDYSVFTVTHPDSDMSEINGTLLLRACKVMTHEVCHMFGLKHCIWMQCLMNGSNHLEESDRRPPHLCPVCLRKLQSVLHFDVLGRYSFLYKWMSGSFLKSKSTLKLKDAKGGQSDAESSHSGSSSAGSTGSRRRTHLHKQRDAKDSLDKHTKYFQPKQTIKESLCKYSTEETPATLMKFHSFRQWLLNAIEFISTDGRPDVFSTYSSQLSSLYS